MQAVLREKRKVAVYPRVCVVRCDFRLMALGAQATAHGIIQSFSYFHRAFFVRTRRVRAAVPVALTYRLQLG